MSDVVRTLPAWSFTRMVSPRESVRVANVVIDGEISNRYGDEWPITNDEPGFPWAMNLADESRVYRFIAFDLDPGRGNPVYDAGRLGHWLDELNIAHLVCKSGRPGGRHVWIALAEGIPAEQVARIAQLAKSLLPSLDIAPLMNPVTGCVRPPGAPHRHAAPSTPLSSVDIMLTPTVVTADIDAFDAFLIDAGGRLPAGTITPLKGMAVDEDGHPHLIGRKRSVGARITSLLSADPGTDASLTLYTVLAGLARARWRFTDVLTLLPDSPALEHARSRITRTGRTALTPQGARKQLAHDWKRAVVYVASSPMNGTHQDDTFRDRAHQVANVVRLVQETADTQPGRWGQVGTHATARTTRGSYSARIVLDAICLYLLQAAAPSVEIDTRRLSADTGFGRTTISTALATLSHPDSDDPETAWIVKVLDADGPHGPHYRLSHKFSTETKEPNWTQGVTRPEIPGPTHRTVLLTQLTQRLNDFAHDVFSAPHSLGRIAARVYLHLTPGGSATTDEVTTTTGLSSTTVRAALYRLHSNGLAVRANGGWSRPPHDQRDHAAQSVGTDGYLSDRRDRYDRERAVWAWWVAEYTWMTKENKKRRSRRTATGVVLFAQNDRPEFPQYPRGPDKRGDHRSARTLVKNGALTPTARLTAWCS